MNRKTVLAAALAAGSLLGFTSVAQAVPAVVAPAGSYPAYPSAPIVYDTAGPVLMQPPPAPIYEAMPNARPGQLWSPGHYVWHDGRYMWQSGEWISARPGYAWQAPQWQQDPDGSWHLASGHWVSTDRLARLDRDAYGDMDNDGVRNADDRDRDGDGIANRNDDFPRDPNRS